MSCQWFESPLILIEKNVLDSHWGRSPGAIARLLPLAVFSRSGGKSRRRNRAFTAASDTDLAVLGDRPDAITRMRQSQQQWIRGSDNGKGF